MKFRINHDPKVSVGITFDEPSRTQQHFKTEADIDFILKKYSQTGFLVDPMTPRRAAQFGDFTSGYDFRGHQQKIVQLKELFDALPSSVRSTFGNDPFRFAEYASKDENRSQLEQWGLLDPLPAPKPARVEPTPSPVPPQAEPPKTSSEAS